MDWDSRPFPTEDDEELTEALAFAEKLNSPADDEPSPPKAFAFRTVTLEDDGLHLTEPETAPAPADEPAASANSIGNRLAHAVFPFVGDPPREWVRKLLLLVALVVFVLSGSSLLNESVVIPHQNQQLNQTLQNILVQSKNGELTEEEAAYDGYPEGISTDFKKLYYLNNDVRGWLTYPGCGIDNVVMYSSEPDYYLYRDIYRSSNKNGSLYLDVRNDLYGPQAAYRSTVIYGHNMASGQMFAQLNNLAADISNMKGAGSVIRFDTLYASNQYKIFAVVLQDPNAPLEQYYSIQDVDFVSDESFLGYVDGLRARSLYNFEDVDVGVDDELLILYTCAPKSLAKFDDARLAVIARKVRTGESASTGPNAITVNEDVIMPYAWYTAQKETPHAVYTGSGSDEPTTTPTDDPTAPSDGETVPSDGDNPTGPIDGSDPAPTTPTDPTPSGGDADPTDPVEPTAPTEPSNPGEPTDPAPSESTDGETEPTEPTDPTPLPTDEGDASPTDASPDPISTDNE